MFLVHICATRYAKPFKADNKYCKVFPFDDMKSALAFAEWFLTHEPPCCIRLEKMEDEGLEEELLVHARDNSDIILHALEDDGKPDEEDINDCDSIS